MDNVIDTTPAFGPRFWMVYVDGRHGPTRKHESYESAYAEAERLARLNPGAKVSVLSEMGTCCTAEPAVRWSY